MIQLSNTNYYPFRKPTPLIIQVGVGGTGSKLSQQIAQMLSVAESGYYVLADPDIVEEKNLRNQLFTEGNVGKPKAEILAKRYSAAYNIPVYSYTEGYVENTVTLNKVFSTPFQHNGFGGKVLPVLIGCVDNNYSRKIMHDFFHHEQVKDIVYIDAGNESVELPANIQESMNMNSWNDEEKEKYQTSGWSGQVVCGVKLNGVVRSTPVADVYPDILEDKDEIAPSSLSCEEISSSDPQRTITNSFAATVLSSYIAEIIEAGTISNHRTVFHSKRAYMKSESIK